MAAEDCQNTREPQVAPEFVKKCWCCVLPGHLVFEDILQGLGNVGHSLSVHPFRGHVIQVPVRDKIMCIFSARWFM